MPVWHVSISLQDRKGFRHDPDRLERFAIEVLDGVGNDREWWCHPRHVGHLRVGVTDEEHAMIPCGVVIGDAGETGPERVRRRLL